MRIFKGIIDNFPIYYKNEKFMLYFYNCPALKKEVDNFTLHSSKIKIYIDNATFYSEKIAKISGQFIIGKSKGLSDKFPYPFILDCDNPILFEAVDGNIVKLKSLSDLVSVIRKTFVNPNENNSREIYIDLCNIYGKDFINEILP